MKHADVKTLKRACRLQKTVRFFTKHPQGDAYNGIVLSLSPERVLFQCVDNFKLDGVIALPGRRIKSLRLGPFERTIDKIIRENGGIKKLKAPDWLKKAGNVGHILMECRHRKVWPIVETQSKGKTALFIGPILRLHPKWFELLGYSADGKWEPAYQIPYGDIFKIELFDDYSKYFNRYMSKRLPKKFSAFRPAKTA